MLSELFFGSLRASDLMDTPPPSHNSLFSLDFWRHLAQEADSAHLVSQMPRERSVSISQDNVSIYEKIIYAISMSISYFLAKTDYYIPLSSNIFLGPRIVEDHILRYGVEYIDSSSPLNSFYLEVQWLSCGTLLIYSYPDHSREWHNLIGRFSGRSRFYGSELRLAPFEAVAMQYYQDPEDFDDKEIMELDEESRLQGLKPSILSLLEQHGLQLSEHCEWVRVNINSTINDLGGSRSDVLSVGSIPWPAHLCFYEDSGSMTKYNAPFWLWPGLKEGAKDPLKAAETWFLGKDMRDKAMEQKRVENEAQRRINPQKIFLDEDDLILSSGFQNFDRHMDVQGLGGIYPTPPDGSKLQPLGHASDHGLHERPNNHNDTDMLDPVDGQNSVLERTDQQNGLDAVKGMSIGAYGDIVDDDLFGDMDSAMFTAKGITEDDFDFFDEPEELNSYAHSVSGLEPAMRRELSADLVTKQALLAELSNPRDIDMTLDEAHSTTEMEDIPAIESSRTEDEVCMPPEVTQNRSSPQGSRQHSENNLEHNAILTSIHNITPQPTHYRLKRTSSERLSIFGNVPLWETSQTLDRKYEDRGRFSIDAGRQGGATYHEPYPVEKSIPLLGQPAGNDEDELESDEG